MLYGMTRQEALTGIASHGGSWRDMLAAAALLLISLGCLWLYNRKGR